MNDSRKANDMKHTKQLVLILAAVLLCMGCSALQREQAGQAAIVVGAAADAIEERKDDPLAEVAEIVQAKLAEMHQAGLLLPDNYHAALAALQQTMDEVDAAMPAPEVVDSWIAEMRRFQMALQAVADAPDESAAVAEAIAGAAAMAAPFAGPSARTVLPYFTCVSRFHAS